MKTISQPRTQSDWLRYESQSIKYLAQGHWTSGVLESVGPNDLIIRIRGTNKTVHKEFKEAKISAFQVQEREKRQPNKIELPAGRFVHNHRDQPHVLYVPSTRGFIGGPRGRLRLNCGPAEARIYQDKDSASAAFCFIGKTFFKGVEATPILRSKALATWATDHEPETIDATCIAIEPPTPPAPKPAVHVPIAPLVLATTPDTCAPCAAASLEAYEKALNDWIRARQNQLAHEELGLQVAMDMARATAALEIEKAKRQ